MVAAAHLVLPRELGRGFVLRLLDMPAEVATAIIAAPGALIVAAAGYWFTKKRERDAELRKEKLDHYKEFVASLSGIISGEAGAEGQRAFALACNKLNLVAPQAVLTALQNFQQEIKASNPSPRNLSRHDDLMSRLFLEMRKDMGVWPGDDATTFRVGLWASGVPSAEPSVPPR